MRAFERASLARKAGRETEGRVRGSKFDVFRTSNQELRTRNFELRTSVFWLSLFVDPFNAGDFRCAIPSQRKKRPAEPTIDIELAARLSVMSIDPPIASGREPERRYARYAPLASVTVPAEDQIDGVVDFQLVEDVRRMGQQEDVSVLCARRRQRKSARCNEGSSTPTMAISPPSVEMKVV